MKNLLKAGVDLEELTSIPEFTKESLDAIWGRKDHYKLSRAFYNYLNQFLLTHVGKSYNKSKNEFCENALSKGFPKVFYGEKLEQKFEREFAEFNERWAWKYAKYYIKNGIICKNLNAQHHKQRKDIEISPAKFLYAKLNLAKVYTYPNLFETLEQTLGKEKTVFLITSRLTKSHLNKIKNDLKDAIDKQVIQPTTIKELRKAHRAKHRYYYHTIPSKYGNSEAILKAIFDIVYSKPVVIKAGSPEWKKYWATKTNQSKRRKRSKFQRESCNQIVYDKAIALQKARIKEEQELDIINRDRLGFDENSFKGEFYHGQKRKKKKVMKEIDESGAQGVPAKGMEV